jgi:hypothetical protein
MISPGAAIAALIHPLFTPLPDQSCERRSLNRALSRLALRMRRGGGIKMKKIIVFVAFLCALAALAVQPSVEAPRQAAMETLSPSAMMQTSRWLPTEAYDAI